MSSISTTLIDLLHSPSADPEVISTTNPSLLSPSSEEFITSYKETATTLKGYIADAEEGKFHVSEKVKAFWGVKLKSYEELIQVLDPKANDGLKKQYLEKANQVWKVGLKEVLEKVNKELVGPYALGSSWSQSFSASLQSVCRPFCLRCLPSFPNSPGPSEVDTEP